MWSIWDENQIGDTSMVVKWSQNGFTWYVPIATKMGSVGWKLGSLLHQYYNPKDNTLHKKSQRVT